MKTWFTQHKKYYAKNPAYNMVVHTIFGIGLGFLLTYPLAGPHPVRWGVFFVLAAAAGMFMAGKW